MSAKVCDRVSERPAELMHPPELAAADIPYLVPWGRPQTTWVITVGVPLLGLAAVWAWFQAAVGGVVLLLALTLFAFLLLFFRNPRRTVPMVAGALVAPADGTVWDIEEVEEGEFITEPTLRIGIFLSIFNVHVNRAPAAGRIIRLTYRPGAFHDARDEAAARDNEANWIELERDDLGGPPGVRLLIKQISGAVARRIVCPLREGMAVGRGGLVGLIKYGSRTELYVPVAAGPRLHVRVGDKVEGGQTVLATLVDQGEPRSAKPDALSPGSETLLG